MEKNHPVSELMSETIQRIREAVDANTVVGTPIVAGEITLIPVSRISLGFGTAGSEVGARPQGPGGESLRRRGGAGLKIIPVCFLVVSGGMVKVLSVDAAPETSLTVVN
ncbi:MAG: GerW family sporulation protein [Evtepia sp.]